MPKSSVRLSILDQAPVLEGSSVTDAIMATVDPARMADEIVVLTVAASYEARQRSALLLAESGLR
jgi:hypothetical protein